MPKQLEGRFEFFADEAEGRPHALFYLIDTDGQLHHSTTFKLVDATAPDTALISEDGQFLVTLLKGLDWNGEVAIYRTDGSLIRALSVEDILTTRDVEFLRAFRSSLNETKLSISDDSQDLVIRIDRCITDPCSKQRALVALHLADGMPLHPAIDLMPQPTVSLHPAVAPSGQDRQGNPGDPSCAEQASFALAPEVPFESLQTGTDDLALPSFTQIALKARVQGSVVLELLVDDGTVACVRTLKGLPMGLLSSARDAVLHWRFSPSQDRKGPIRSVVAFDFRFDAD